jgi:hypothetical protein
VIATIISTSEKPASGPRSPDDRFFEKARGDVDLRSSGAGVGVGVGVDRVIVIVIVIVKASGYEWS